MARCSHRFVDEYDGMIGFGLDRSTNEATLLWTLQKVSSDELGRLLAGRMSDDELEELFEGLSRLLRSHLSEPEYHRLFLGEEGQGG